MQMTHYMQLLADNQPWNLLLFMVVPVVLAETVAVTELYILFTRNFTGQVKKLNTITGTTAGIYFLGVFFYLFFNAVIPLTTDVAWRGAADVIAVGFYLLGVIPLGGLALLGLGLFKKSAQIEEKIRWHAIFVAIFLIVAHIAMIFGMLNPTKLGWTPSTNSMPIMTESTSR